MKTAHTPAPWHAYAIGAAQYVATASGYTLARVDASYAYKGAHAANARLIAAAPELLAHLEDALQFVDYVANNGNADADELARNIRALVNKTKGTK